MWQGKYLPVNLAHFYSLLSVTDILPASPCTIPCQHCVAYKKAWWFSAIHGLFLLNIQHLSLTSTHFHSPYNPAERTCVFVCFSTQQGVHCVNICVVFYLFDFCIITALSSFLLSLSCLSFCLPVGVHDCAYTAVLLCVCVCYENGKSTADVQWGLLLQTPP